MADATKKFRDEKGELVGTLMVDVIEHDGENTTVRWVVVGRNGRPLSGEESMKVPRPTRGETDDLLPLAVGEIVKARVGRSGGSAGSKKAGAKSHRPFEEEELIEPDEWQFILMMMKRYARGHREKERGLGRVLSLLGR